MRPASPPTAGRLRRLAEELAESGLALDQDEPLDALVLTEVWNALRPPVHERRVFSTGAIVSPTTDPSTWEQGTELDILRGPVGDLPLADLRRFADGLSSWVMRYGDGHDEWVVFDRPAGSERDLVVLADVLGATMVQRHPTGSVRVVGDFGVLRWQGIEWQHVVPVTRLLPDVDLDAQSHASVLRALLEFAVHDLGSRGIGAILVLRPDGASHPGVEPRHPAPPPLEISRPLGLAPLRHALSQIDGAAVFDATGTLRHLGARLIPSRAAETTIDGYHGMRHTAGRRYSWDDEHATVIVVSEDGPVTVFRNGSLVRRTELTAAFERVDGAAEAAP